MRSRLTLHKTNKFFNRWIGFHDTWHIAIMLPLLAFVIPIVFFSVRFNKPPYYTWQIYLNTFLITSVVWLGNRWIMIFARKRYPDFERVRKRLWVQSCLMLIYTFFTTNTLGFLLKDFC